MYSQRSKEDQVARISRSVFVTNFPNNFGSRDLWKLCEAYGNVVDVSIPNRKFKAGKRFAFVRFIRVVDLVRLIGNLCTLWVGRFHLHVNAIRYERPCKPINSVRNSLPKEYNKSGSYAPAVKDFQAPIGHVASSFSSPALVLDDSCIIERDLSRHAMGRVKDLNFITNLQSILTKEGFSKVKLSYLGGMWVLLELDTVAIKKKLLQHTRVNSWFLALQNATHDFGEAMDIKECSVSSFARKRLCIKTKLADNILERFNVIFKGKTFRARAKDLFDWTPQFQDFKHSEYTSDDESPLGTKSKPVDQHVSDDELVGESDDEGVSETLFGDKPSSPCKSVCNNSTKVDDQHSEDPFGFYELLKKTSRDNVVKEDPSLSHHSSFTPEVSQQADNHNSILHKENSTDPVCVKEFTPNVHSNVINFSQETHVNESSGGISSSKQPHNMCKGGSILEVLDDMIRIFSLNVQGLGHKTKKEWVKELNIKHNVNFLALQETKMDCISHMDVKFLWGNSNYQFIASDSVGNSGGILCIWEESIFKRDCVSISDNFIAIYGTWLPNNSKLLIVVIYAPQSPVLKRILWDYISGLISRWNGEVIVMGDFNAARSGDERFGSLFNLSCARDFNQFISSSGLMEIKTEGYSFTWSHPSATKMSKLDRFLVSKGIILDFPSITTVCLDRHLSNHRPILLREIHIDFGPCPFRIYHSWFKRDGFDVIVEQAWNSFSHSDPNRLISGYFPKGSNASFIALIPKVTDAKFVTEFGPISLIGSVYKVITKILANRLAVVISDLVSDTQSAFVANRQILDRPFVLNELLSWCKRKKKQALIFKVDFAKAYDSVYWDYLLDVLQAFGFGPNWCKWIHGIQLQESISISHLFYADDAIFIREWSDDNLGNLVIILKCFYLASGLKINLQKSQVLGVGVHRDVVNPGASLIGCDVMNSPFTYLGVTVGDHMIHNSSWASIIKKIQARLSKWKSKTLSVGGRLTLLKWVLGAASLYTMSIYKAPKGVLHVMESIRIKFFNGDDPSKRMITWIAWGKVLAFKKNGGLGVSSLHALNRALLLKWVWRFLSQDGSIWSRVINAIYGSSLASHSVKFSSPWCSILREVQVLSAKGFDFVSHCKQRVGNGHNTRFWLDTCILDMPLSVRFPRMFPFERDKQIYVAAKWGASSFDASFHRQIRDGIERQQWMDLLSILYDLLLPSSSEAIRWVKFIPIKINIFTWHVRLDRLPTRCNLLNRGSVVGGIFIGLMSRRLLNGMLGSLVFGCPLSLSLCWRVSFILLGGIFGIFGIILYSAWLLRDDQ
nr:RNA-directed DNA polymerase, eukaryota [Tanacetum cinerariifolium]